MCWNNHYTPVTVKYIPHRSAGSRQAAAVTQTLISTTPSPPHVSPPHLVQETRFTLDQLEQETEQLQIHYQQLFHTPSLPTLTRSPPHTPTSCAVLSWPVGGASSMTTTSSSVPLTVHTTYTKTTPTGQLPKTTPTSFPARTTPISVPNIPPKTTPTLHPNCVPETTPTTNANLQSGTTPTTSIAPPQAAPTTESAVPRLSLDQLWRQPSQHDPPTTAVSLSSSSSLRTTSVSVSLPQPTTSLPKIVSSSRHPTTSIPSTPPALFSQTALVSSANSADPSTLVPSTAAGFSLSPSAAYQTSSLSPALPTTSITTLFPTTAAYQTSSLSPVLPTATVSSVYPTTSFPTVSTSVSRHNVTATPPSSVERAMETKETEDVTSSAETKGGVDPLMMKYMELVAQKRAEEKREGRGQQPLHDFSLSEQSQVSYSPPSHCLSIIHHCI